MLSQNIAHYRKQKGLSQESLAELMEVSRQAVTKWETGASKPSSENLIRLGELLDVSVDTLLGNSNLQETNEITEITTGKAPLLYISLSALCILAYLVASIVLDRFDAGTLICLFILFAPMQSFIHLFFSNAIKYNSFDGIAGYDNSIEYNTDELKKLLVKIDLNINMSTTVYIFLIALFNFLNSSLEWINGILIVTYVFEFITIILINNYKIIDKLYINQEDSIKAKRGFPITILFIFLLLAGTLITIVSLVVKKIENNTMDALFISGLLIVGMLFATIAYFLQNKAIQTNKNTSKASIVCLILCIVSYILILFI